MNAPRRNSKQYAKGVFVYKPIDDKGTVRGSALMRAFQIGQATGWSVTTLENYYDVVPDISTIDYTIIVKTHYDSRELCHLSKRTRLLVYDTVDTLALSDDSGSLDALRDRWEWYQCIIVPNEAARILLIKGGYTGIVIVIHHHWDPRLKDVRIDERPSEVKTSDMIFGFMGCGRNINMNLCHSAKLGNLLGSSRFKVFDTESGTDITSAIVDNRPDEIDNLRHNNNNFSHETVLPFMDAQLSIREGGSMISMYKTNAKISTAAALGQLIFTTREQTALELLGDDYPFYFEDSSWDCVSDKLSSAVSLDDICKARNILANVKKLTCIDYIADQYKNDLHLALCVHSYTTYLKRKLEYVFGNMGNEKLLLGDKRCLVYRCVFNYKPSFTMPDEPPLCSTLISDEKKSTHNDMQYDYILFTDDETLFAPDYYHVVVLPSMYTEHIKNCRRSNATWGGTLSNRILKMLVPELCQSFYSMSIYADYSMNFTDRGVYGHEWSKMSDNFLLASSHFGRHTAHDEMDHIMGCGLESSKCIKYAKRVFDLLSDSWRNMPLTENGILFRVHSNACFISMRIWLHCFMYLVNRDQCSLQFSLDCTNNSKNNKIEYLQVRNIRRLSCVYPSQTLTWDITQPYAINHFVPRVSHTAVFDVCDDSSLPVGLHLDRFSGEIFGTPDFVKDSPTNQTTLIRVRNEEDEKIVPLKFFFLNPSLRDGELDEKSIQLQKAKRLNKILLISLISLIFIMLLGIGVRRYFFN